MHAAITAGGSWVSVDLVWSQTGKAEFSRLQNSGGVWSRQGRTHKAYLLHLVCKKIMAGSDVKRGLFPPKTQEIKPIISSIFGCHSRAYWPATKEARAASMMQAKSWDKSCCFTNATHKKNTKNKRTQKQPPHQSNLWRQRRRGNVFAVLRLKGGNDQVQVLDDPNIYTSVSRPVKTTFSAKTKT